MASSSKEVFLSYSRKKELEPFVRKLKHDLEGKGLSVWLDIEDIPPGSDRYALVGSAFYNCKCLIAVLSNCYISSKYCKSELYPAEESEKVIIPVVYESINYQLSDKAMGVKYILGGLEHMHFVPNIDDYEFSLNKLMDTLKQHCVVSDCTGPTNPHQNTTMMPNPTESTDMGEQQDLSKQMTGLTVSDTATAPEGPYLPRPPPDYNDIYPTDQQPPPPVAPAGGYPPYQPMQYPPSTYPAYPPMATSYPSQPTPGPYQQYPPPGYPSSPGFPPPPGPPPGVPPTPISGQAPHKPSTPPQKSSPQAQPGRPTGGSGGNPFGVGMKLEALDRRFPYYICVATIDDVRGDEVKIHFDGWGPEYDYWCSYDMVELHPVGWCNTHGYELQKPRNTSFPSWDRYLSQTGAKGCDATMFNEIQVSPPGGLHFRAGMKIEAVDRKYPTLTCVATIKEVNTRNKKLLIHFDDWSDDYDYWCKPDTTDIHPPMWCSKKGKELQKPQGFQGSFKWNIYLSDPDKNPAPAHIFTKKQLK